MNTRHHILTAGIILSSSLLLAADPATPTVSPSVPPPTPAPVPAFPPPSNPATIKGIEVHDWVILICNPHKPTANSPEIVRSSLPENVATRRPSVPGTDPLAKAPSPMGMIRLYGEPHAEIDVVLEIKSGDFLGAHPYASRKPQRLLWDRLAATTESANATPIRPEHWLATWRGGPALYLTARGIKEQWLLYDPEFQHKSPLSLGAAGPTRYGLVNAGDPPIHDVTIYRPGDDGWRVATRDLLPGRKALTPSPPANATTSGPFDPKPAISVAPPPPAAPAGPPAPVTPTAPSDPRQPPGVNPTPPAPAEEPKDDAAARLIRLSSESQKDAATLLEPWRLRLLEMGFFEQDVAAILAELKQHALDEKRLTAIYRIDPAELDKMLPLDVTPTPSRKVRVGLVILTGSDPGKKDQIAAWIEQLGDPQWPRREEAEKLIAAEGPGAVAQLKEALKHRDREISFRAERVLEIVTPPELDANGNPKN